MAHFIEIVLIIPLNVNGVNKTQIEKLSRTTQKNITDEAETLTLSGCNFLMLV
jgi:hypothetical protein